MNPRTRAKPGETFRPGVVNTVPLGGKFDKYCQYCGCWIVPAEVAAHNRSTAHREKVATVMESLKKKGI